MISILVHSNITNKKVLKNLLQEVAQATEQKDHWAGPGTWNYLEEYKKSNITHEIKHKEME